MKEADLKQATLEYIRKIHPADAFIIDELNVSRYKNIADIVIWDGKFHCYELKSEKDNTKRLRQQLDTYKENFDHVTVICSKKHLGEVLHIIQPDEEVSVICAERFPSRWIFKKELNRKSRNVGVSIYQLSSLLWKNELVDLLKELGDEATKTKLKSFSKEGLRFRLSSILTRKVLKVITRRKEHNRWHRLEKMACDEKGHFVKIKGD